MDTLRDLKHMSNVVFDLHEQCDELMDLSALIQADDDESDDNVIIYKVMRFLCELVNLID